MIKTHYNFDEDVVYVVSDDNFTIHDFNTISDEILEKYGHLDRLFNLDDLRIGNFKFQLNSILADLDYTKAMINELSGHFKSIHTAVVFKKIPNESLTNFFVNLKKPKNYNIRILSDYNDAMQWLSNERKRISESDLL